jgi:hypothetical protein
MIVERYPKHNEMIGSLIQDYIIFSLLDTKKLRSKLVTSLLHYLKKNQSTQQVAHNHPKHSFCRFLILTYTPLLPASLMTRLQVYATYEEILSQTKGYEPTSSYPPPGAQMTNLENILLLKAHSHVLSKS